MKSILFNSWSGAFFKQGGGEAQLLQSKAALERQGVHVELFDMWKPQDNFQIFHQFSIERGVEHVVRAYKEKNKKIALSTILWADIPPADPLYRHIVELMGLADILFTNSDAESDLLSRVFDIPRDKFHKTRNAIGQEFLSDGDAKLFRKALGFDGKFVLSVANIDTRKNTEMLVQVCKEQNIPLVSVGHIKDQGYYSRFKSMYDQFIHMGPIEDKEMLKSAYKACAVFALPSYCETPSIAALEAASQGAPIVITGEGSTKEYFLDHAEYVVPSDKESLRAALLKSWDLMRQDKLQAVVRREYVWDSAAIDLLNGYKKIH